MYVGDDSECYLLAVDKDEERSLVIRERKLLNAPDASLSNSHGHSHDHAPQ